MMAYRSFFFGAAALLVSATALVADAANPSGDVWTRVNDSESAVSYSPGMKQMLIDGYYQNDMHASMAPDEWCQFSFVGTGAKWIGAKNVNHGTADVYLDGKLDATVSTESPSWLMQQALYTKTGLTDGLHSLKIVVKAGGYEDFDAFEYLAPPARSPGPIDLGSVDLPAQVPYLNVPHRYPVGNGVVAAVCGPTGQWVQLAGPGYTAPNFINTETLALELDGAELPLSVEMKRAEKTGVFYGSTTRGDLDISLIDYTCRGQPWITRLLLVTNTSPTASHDVRVSAQIAPKTDRGLTHWLTKDAAGNDNGFTIQADANTGLFCGSNKAPDKSVTISFADPSTSASLSGDVATIETKPVHLAPHGHAEIALNHYFREGHDMSDSACLDALRGLKSVANLGKTIAEWQAWFDGVSPRYSLSRIKDKRGRQSMEGALVILKTNQSQDGGVLAHTTFYKEGYVRDAAMAIRGLLAAGHTEEAKQWLVWIDNKLALYGHLGDAMGCEPSLSDPSGIFNMGNMEVEEPGWVLLCARDYYNQTHDLATLKNLDRTMRYCMDIQLKDAAANGDKLEFNGDETEICQAVNIRSTGSVEGEDAQRQEWALSSVAMAAASLDFYIHYVKMVGDDPAAYHNAQTKTTMDLNAELAHLLAAMDRDFWRTDVPEFPAGFHDFFRKKSDMSWPLARLGNFTLMPIYFGVSYPQEKKADDVAVIAHYFDPKSGFLQLVPSENVGMEGHDLGYLLWGLVETGDWRKDEVYQALICGKTVDCWGSYNEAYDAVGHPNDHDLRSLETGINVSAMSKYWGLGLPRK
jgi:hypothetical protein